ncbi:hypothetical protein SVAN01_04921 [Stagonosporopsis vannaccii]|nr:hypothetical protein SVAN01_04921 [Stagonosporopsis vannaccii]
MPSNLRKHMIAHCSRPKSDNGTRLTGSLAEARVHRSAAVAAAAVCVSWRSFDTGTSLTSFGPASSGTPALHSRNRACNFTWRRSSHLAPQSDRLRIFIQAARCPKRTSFIAADRVLFYRTTKVSVTQLFATIVFTGTLRAQCLVAQRPRRNVGLAA